MPEIRLNPVKRMRVRATFDRDLLEGFTEDALKALELSKEEVGRGGVLHPEHLILGLMRGCPDIANLLLSLGIHHSEVRMMVRKSVDTNIKLFKKAGLLLGSPLIVFKLARAEALLLGHKKVGPEHLLLALLNEGYVGTPAVFENLGLRHIMLRDEVVLYLSEMGNKYVLGNEMPMLKMLGSDLTELAKEGKLEKFVGRAEQADAVLRILRRKGNPCLVGDSGVGKTALVKAVAQKIATSGAMTNKKIVSINIGALVGGTTYRGELEERISKLVKEVQDNRDVIIYFDEIHTLIGAGASADGQLDVANLLKPALSNGDIQCIGSTTFSEYLRYFQRDSAFSRRFDKVMIPEPSAEETIEMLKGSTSNHEILSNLVCADEVLVAAVQLANDYISDCAFPEKAIRLIIDAASFVAEVHEQKGEEAGVGVITEDDLRHVLAISRGIPLAKMSSDEVDLLLRMEENLGRRIIGQNEAVRAISLAIRRGRLGLKNPRRPIASFMFCGPTGVGKSELSKIVGTEFFRSLIHLNMSEFMDRESISKLIGSPPGYTGYTEGGQLTDAVCKHPYSVVLLDEIEKAHKDIFNLLLQILEDGRVTDSSGKIMSFQNTVIIMTSNVGSALIEKRGMKIGFDFGDEEYSSYNHRKGLVIEELKLVFPPELLNRLDDIIVFRQLTKDEVKEITDILIKESISLIKNVKVKVTDLFKMKVVEEGYDISYGARPIRRAITKLLLDSLATKLLSGEVKDGDSVTLDVDREGSVLVVNENNDPTS